MIRILENDFVQVEVFTQQNTRFLTLNIAWCPSGAYKGYFFGRVFSHHDLVLGDHDLFVLNLVLDFQKKNGG